MKHLALLVVVVVSLTFLGVTAMAAKPPAPMGSSDWPQWRGPDRNGVAPNSPKLMDSYSAEGPKMVWKSDYIPTSWQGGWSSPVVAEGKLFLYVNWLHPNGGGNYLKPLTPQFLESIGWIPGVPDDLAAKLEAAWASKDRPDAAACPKLGDLVDGTVDLNAFLAKQPALDKYVKDFVATLNPAEAKKYGTFITRRLCMRPKGFQGGETWENLIKYSKYENQEFKTIGAFSGAMDKIGPQSADGSVRIWGLNKGCTKTDTIICLDAATGKTLWKKDFEASEKHYPYPESTTAAVANGKVYFCGKTGLYCLSARDGSEVWSDKHGGSQASVLVDGDLVFDPSSAKAFNADTGKVIWATKNWMGASGDTSPVLWVHDGKRYIISATCCIDEANGHVLWARTFKAGPSTPVIVGDDMVSISTDIHGYTLTPEAATEVWKQPWGGMGEWRGSPLLYQGYVYFSDVNKQTWRCLDMKTGAVKWQEAQKGTDMSSGVLADGKIITLAMPGHSHNELGCDVVIFRADPEKYQELCRFKPRAASCESPALADGRLYFRTEDPEGDYGVACYDLRAGGR